MPVRMSPLLAKFYQGLTSTFLGTCGLFTYGFLLERVAVGRSLGSVVLGALDRTPLSRFSSFPGQYFTPRHKNPNLHVQVVNVMPLNLERLFLIIDLKRQPDVAAFPQGIRVPLPSKSAIVYWNSTL